MRLFDNCSKQTFLRKKVIKGISNGFVEFVIINGPLNLASALNIKRLA